MPGTAVTARAGTPAGFPELNSFRRPQFRAAGSRVTIAFLFRCRYRFFRQDPVVLVLIRAFAEGILYDAVLQRVKANHYDSPTWLQNLRRCLEQRLQIVQFAVYEDSKSLKSPASLDEFDVPLGSLAGPRLI